ncbi:MAG TPA: hypothetical protein PK079_09170 [Leptospiraceae bacterium]|nr:hypothetical protein [Leptospiraceae bacterium]HMW06845.1 hypothetical protein [Leptospiraceae bacterium]HMX32253.1 hypothetical protein [Leptospiraceae bacterium]HMY32364.1 hypothetical protein [Leptospiraceae bacterium]HMZ66992.1 hypothetical protein [Leptospiraceae bacterium]
MNKKIHINKYKEQPKKEFTPLSEKERQQLIKQMDEAMEKDRTEYAKWWKTLTPEQQKEHDDDVSRLCDVEL